MRPFSLTCGISASALTVLSLAALGTSAKAISNSPSAVAPSASALVAAKVTEAHKITEEHIGPNGFNPLNSNPNQYARHSGVAFRSTDLSSNRSNDLSPSTIQIAVWYDGDADGSNPPTLEIEYFYPTNQTYGWLEVGTSGDPGGAIANFSERIETREFELGDAVLTGKVRVSGVTPNGVIDGIAFGAYAKYFDGTYHVLKSIAPDPSPKANFVGAWPLGLSDALVAEKTPQLTSSFGREQVKMMLYGAQYLGNGTYQIESKTTRSK